MKNRDEEVIDASNETLFEWVREIFDDRYANDKSDEDEFDEFFPKIEQIYMESRIFYRYIPDNTMLGWSLLDYDDNMNLTIKLFTKN